MKRIFRNPNCVGPALAVAGLLVALAARAGADEFAADLPAGALAAWGSDGAERETTPTRERISLNGLWRWQPADPAAIAPPKEHWGYFKVPGCWPGISDYMQKDCQTVFAHPSWAKTNLAEAQAAWYERELTVPEGWAGRRIALGLEYLNSLAAVYVDGKPAGRLHFPGGKLDLTAACGPQPGKHLLSLLVVALPLQESLVSYHDSARARTEKGTVARRGLCGDVWLSGEPAGPRIGEVRLETSVRQGRITLDVALENLVADAPYRLRARIADDSGALAREEFTGPAFRAAELNDGRFTLGEAWLPDKLWDVHTPQNLHRLSLTLLDERGKPLDEAAPVRFGFREFWIEGRDFYLNGSRIFLSAVPLDNAQVSAGTAGYAAACESLRRLKSIGINFVYTHNYGCEPGSHLGFAEILRAADDMGMLVAFSQPHFSHYDWKAADADRENGYARHAAFYVRAAQNHPAVVCYAMSHNGTGYDEDMNPDMIDGRQDARDPWAVNNVKLARRAEAIVAGLDPARIVYHHASGNLGPMHTSNFYPNFVPIQELCDWFEHWATTGIKPVFLCEYGAPFTWDWGMYRGWYQGKREFGSAEVPWELCFAEWNAQFLGDRAFRIGDEERANLRWEAGQVRGHKLWHRWDYPFDLSNRRFNDRNEVLGRYIGDNWRAFRTWGLSANSPWEFGQFWQLREGVGRARAELPVDWRNLQRPGFSADYIDQRYERMDLAFAAEDWLPTAAGQALLRNNQPLLAYIAGGPDAFTGKEHNYLPGETAEKQLIVINNARETVSGTASWSADLPQAPSGTRKFELATGQQLRIPLSLRLPETLEPQTYALRAHVDFAGRDAQHDAFSIQVLPRPQPPEPDARIALFDPLGQTAALLKTLGIAHQSIDAAADVSKFDLVVIGKQALTAGGAAPDLSPVERGLKVLIFEQTAEALEKRLGLRSVEYGLRQVFPRVPDHPAIAGIGAAAWSDWRGAATLLSPQLKYERVPQHGPTVRWCDIPVSRPWRCGNRGNVASVLIEKPARGDFLPLVDGGYSLQYSPLMEYREGRGVILFCQLDVTGRTEAEPVARAIAGDLFSYLAGWKASPRRRGVVYAGEPEGQRHLEAAGFSVQISAGGELPPADRVLVVGPGGAQKFRPIAVSKWLDAGGRLLLVGLGREDIGHCLGPKVETRPSEHIAAYFDPPDWRSPLMGVGPADVHNRDPRKLPLIESGAKIAGDGVLAWCEPGNVVFCQLAPWQFEQDGKSEFRRTRRRTNFLLTRLLANLGAAADTPLVARFHTPARADEPNRSLAGFYLDTPEEWDDPYRFFRW